MASDIRLPGVKSAQLDVQEMMQAALERSRICPVHNKPYEGFTGGLRKRDELGTGVRPLCHECEAERAANKANQS